MHMRFLHMKYRFGRGRVQQGSGRVGGKREAGEKKEDLINMEIELVLDSAPFS